MLLLLIDRGGQAEKGSFFVFSMYAWLGHDFHTDQELYHSNWIFNEQISQASSDPCAPERKPEKGNFRSHFLVLRRFEPTFPS